MAVIVYLLCAAAALWCTVLLFRAWRRTGNRLLRWSAVCFACLTAENLLVALDLVVLPATDLFVLRNVAA
ncbi:MAG: DUF5985 family protein, partial [Gemmatimonadales bacterium]